MDSKAKPAIPMTNASNGLCSGCIIWFISERYRSRAAYSPSRALVCYMTISFLSALRAVLAYYRA